MMKLKNIRFNKRKMDIYAELYDEKNELVVGATLLYILQAAAERGYKIEGVAENPLGKS